VFERFDERARQVIVLAQEEARALRHDYIGTEHLLLGLLREDRGVAARVLESFDMPVEDVRSQIARIVGQAEEIETGQIPFTPRAKKVLELSLVEALGLGHEHIGTEHILLGLIRENEGVATQILLDFDIDPAVLRGEVLRVAGGESPRPHPRDPRRPRRASPPSGITFSQGSSMRLVGTGHVDRGLPWWQAPALWIGMFLGAVLFAAGLIVGRLVWG
jgi:ATP-dependent Clp protease ATP-binding subunit ClpC